MHDTEAMSKISEAFQTSFPQILFSGVFSPSQQCPDSGHRRKEEDSVYDFTLLLILNSVLLLLVICGICIV